ncbi:MAG: S46 family peptidase [Bacteroidota bacterium]
MKKIVIIIALLFCSSFLKADEGMWFPQMLEQLNIADMQMRGLKISAEDIYSVNKSSLKDAIVLFGGGCTAEIISKQGLLLTNHHCGFGEIQSHSTVEHNYLKDGFWANTLKDELPCPGLTVSFVISIIDVTPQFNQVLKEGMTEQMRNEKIKEVAAQIEKKATEGTQYEAKVRQFFSGNEFYLITTETFKDIRMVGAPPSSIGKFGGDADNWMWPRHTGDFSLFRIYANKDNKPAAYSEENVPFIPRAALSINIGGVQEGDFTMVYGFPGRTQEYISSYAEEMILKTTNPERIKVRTEKLRIMDNAMRSSEQLHIQYAAKQSSVSNGWKKWQGESKGLTESNGLEMKTTFEQTFNQWLLNNPQQNQKYGEVLPGLKQLYAVNRPYISANNYYSEAAYGVELLTYALNYQTLADLSKTKQVEESKMATEKNKLFNTIADFYRDFDLKTDQQFFQSLLLMFDKNVPDSLKPTYFIEQRKKYQGDFIKWSDAIYSKSIFKDSLTVQHFLTNYKASQVKKITEDPAYKLMEPIAAFYKSIVAARVNGMALELGRLNRLYMAAQREMNTSKKYYPDANSTLRVAYGNVKSYFPRDGVKYNYYTTLDGIMEKYIKGDEQFDVSPKLLDLYQRKDYGPYAYNGTVPVAFIATNHTTGGNSGSPVLNAYGQLIGTNFDRVWEGTMSDILFNPDICRNITLDIRYTLFVIDKYGEAKRLINEMDLVK